MRLSRRNLIAAGALVAGCAPADAPPSAPTPAAPTSEAPSATASSPSPSDSPSPSPSPALPGKAEIEAAFADAMPTQWGLDLDGIVQRTDAPHVALTFDACGGNSGSGFDAELIDVLRRLEIPATLFLNSRWIEANRGVTEELVADELFTIGNHGTRHLPLSVSAQEAYGISGTASAGEVFDEIAGCQDLLASLMGEMPRFFRPGTAFYDDVAIEIVRELGLIPVGFDINSDAGATFSASQVSAETRRATPGSICIAHFNKPGEGTAAGMVDALPRMLDEGVTFQKLDVVL